MGKRTNLESLVPAFAKGGDFLVSERAHFRPVRPDAWAHAQMKAFAYNFLRLMTDPTPRKLIIAIDGPAGAGKSTIASRLACKLWHVNLAIGAMYRGLA